MNEYLERMSEHLQRMEQSKIHGLSTREVVGQTYSNDELRQFAENLKSPKAGPNIDFSGFRLASFIFEDQTDRVPEDIRRLAADNVADQVRTKCADEDAVYIFIAWGAHRSDYRNVCQQILDHPKSWIREIGIRNCGRFLRPEEYHMLVEFRHDPTRAETGGMGGPLRFIVRDSALTAIKRLTRCPVAESDCFEDSPDGRAFYKSWSPFLIWFEKHCR